METIKVPLRDHNKYRYLKKSSLTNSHLLILTYEKSKNFKILLKLNNIIKFTLDSHVLYFGRDGKVVDELQ